LINAPEPAAVDPIALSAVVTRSMRCWREACDTSLAVQPHLAGMLAVKACAVLAPVLDSLFCFYEAALERPLSVGKARMLSADERLLVELIESPGLCRARMGCAPDAIMGLNCALCSARVMLSLALNDAALH